MVNAPKAAKQSPEAEILGGLKKSYTSEYDTLQTKTKALFTVHEKNLVAEARVLQIRQIMA